MESLSEPGQDWLNYHHLRYFHTVASEGSLRAAALKLRVSQPSMCTQIKHLEASFGESLFRRSGRALVLTDFGRIVQTYANDIFSLGQELLTASRRGPSGRMMRLNVGIVDSFPKLLSLDLLRPIFHHQPKVLLSCHEGNLEDLLGQLAAHRLDVILTDEPAPSQSSVKTFSHLLGSCGTSFCATPGLAGQLKGRFPGNLNGAPALVPLPASPQRRELERWFRDTGIAPEIVGEFADAALAKIVATEGLGFTSVPTLVALDAVKRYGFEILGQTEACRSQLFLITEERRIGHPAVLTLAKHAVEALEKRNRPGTVQGNPARKPAKKPKPGTKST